MKNKYLTILIVLFLLIPFASVYGLFDVQRISTLRLNGKWHLTYSLGKSEVQVSATWQKFQETRILTLATVLLGSKFTVHPDSIFIFSATDGVQITPMMEPGNTEGKNYHVRKFVFYSFPKFKKETNVLQRFLITTRHDSMPDSVFFKIVPSSYILHKGRPVLKDTIIMSGSGPALERANNSRFLTFPNVQKPQRPEHGKENLVASCLVKKKWLWKSKEEWLQFLKEHKLDEKLEK